MERDHLLDLNIKMKSGNGIQYPHRTLFESVCVKTLLHRNEDESEQSGFPTYTPMLFSMDLHRLHLGFPPHYDNQHRWPFTSRSPCLVTHPDSYIPSHFMAFSDITVLGRDWPRRQSSYPSHHIHQYKDEMGPPITLLHIHNKLSWLFRPEWIDGLLQHTWQVKSVMDLFPSYSLCLIDFIHVL